jgi:hypothetical protein
VEAVKTPQEQLQSQQAEIEWLKAQVDPFVGSLVKEAISTELLSLDRSKIESMFKEIQAIRSKVPSKGQTRLT